MCQYENVKNKDDTIVILQERMCGWLQFNRFHKIAEKKDLKNLNRNIYIFKDTPELQECMNKYENYKDIINNK